jgi:hypothetical protein
VSYGIGYCPLNIAPDADSQRSIRNTQAVVIFHDVGNGVHNGFKRHALVYRCYDGAMPIPVPVRPSMRDAREESHAFPRALNVFGPYLAIKILTKNMPSKCVLPLPTRAAISDSILFEIVKRILNVEGDNERLYG